MYFRDSKKPYFCAVCHKEYDDKEDFYDHWNDEHW